MDKVNKAYLVNEAFGNEIPFLEHETSTFSATKLLTEGALPSSRIGDETREHLVYIGYLFFVSNVPAFFTHPRCNPYSMYNGKVFRPEDGSTIDEITKSGVLLEDAMAYAQRTILTPDQHVRGFA
jgi:hypothetical protein